MVAGLGFALGVATVAFSIIRKELAIGLLGAIVTLVFGYMGLQLLYLAWCNARLSCLYIANLLRSSKNAGCAFRPVAQGI